MTKPLEKAHLRVARPTDKLPEILRFYCDGLGFEELGSFTDHAGFDGVMLGHAGLGYHLEFTHQRGHKSGSAPSKENLLVFYLPQKDEWQRAVAHMVKQGYQPVMSHNPYWDVSGRTFEDADGYRVVLQRAAWMSD
jgi:catechol 2,3-dioxygenase-like lactoylglutathione lyase family enzyme